MFGMQPCLNQRFHNRLQTRALLPMAALPVRSAVGDEQAFHGEAGDEDEGQAGELPLLPWGQATVKFQVGEECIVNRETGKVHRRQNLFPLLFTACGWFHTDRGDAKFIEQLLAENGSDLTACGSCCSCRDNVASEDMSCTKP